MRRRASFLIGILLLTGCTQQETNQNDLVDKAFVKTVREEVGLTFMTNDEIILMGKETCKTDNLFEAIKNTSTERIDESDASFIVGAGWAAYCPENTEKYK